MTTQDGGSRAEGPLSGFHEDVIHEEGNCARCDQEFGYMRPQIRGFSDGRVDFAQREASKLGDMAIEMVERRDKRIRELEARAWTIVAWGFVAGTLVGALVAWWLS